MQNKTRTTNNNNLHSPSIGCYHRHLITHDTNVSMHTSRVTLCIVLIAYLKHIWCNRSWLARKTSLRLPVLNCNAFVRSELDLRGELCSGTWQLSSCRPSQSRCSRPPAPRCTQSDRSSRPGNHQHVNQWLRHEQAPCWRHDDAHLWLNQHGHVHEHVVQLLDALLQLHDVVVSRFDVLQWLSRLRRVGENLRRKNKCVSREQDSESRRCWRLEVNSLLAWRRQGYHPPTCLPTVRRLSVDQLQHELAFTHAHARAVRANYRQDLDRLLVW